MDETPEFSHKYRGGISDGMGCTNGAKDLNHAIQIVGYDLDAGYWLVREQLWRPIGGRETVISVYSLAAMLAV